MTVDTDLKAIQQFNCTGNLDEDGNRIIFFVIEAPKEIILSFSPETVRVF